MADALKIEFKTKPYAVRQSPEPGAPERLAITWKKKLTRADCNLRPQDHDYFNSDLFVGILNRKYRAVIGQYAEFAYLDEMPAGVSVDSSKFLAVVRIADSTDRWRDGQNIEWSRFEELMQLHGVMLPIQTLGACRRHVIELSRVSYSVRGKSRPEGVWGGIRALDAALRSAEVTA